jgi:hypothetical protein
MRARRLQVFARSSKFSLFDPAKEMVYIGAPLMRARRRLSPGASEANSCVSCLQVI